jgi:hypothetical protein
MSNEEKVIYNLTEYGSPTDPWNDTKNCPNHKHDVFLEYEIKYCILCDFLDELPYRKPDIFEEADIDDENYLNHLDEDDFIKDCMKE